MRNIDLSIIAAITILLVPLVILTSGPPRIAVGLVSVLFFPGYCLMAALYPRRASISGIERLALSFGLSLAVVPLMGLVLNFTPWGIRLHTILISLASFVIVMAGVAWYGRQRVGAGDTFQWELREKLASPGKAWAGQGRLAKALTVLLVLSVLGALGSVGYAIAKPKNDQAFTEFYLLGENGKAQDYAQDLMPGEAANVTVGIVNHENRTVTYRVEIMVDGIASVAPGPIVLGDEARWEQPVGFAPVKAGPDQKVEFLLRKDDASGPAQTLHLWVDVGERR